MWRPPRAYIYTEGERGVWIGILSTNAAAAASSSSKLHARQIKLQKASSRARAIPRLCVRVPALSSPAAARQTFYLYLNLRRKGRICSASRARILFSLILPPSRAKHRKRERGMRMRRARDA